MTALATTTTTGRGVGRLRAASAAVALVGLGIASYLTIVHDSGGAPACAIAHGCETVQRSAYAKVGGVPVALAGLVGYVALLVTLLRDDENWRVATVFLALAGLGFSAWLTWVEVGILHAICIWCVGSALCMFTLAGLSVSRVLRGDLSAR